MLNNNHVFVEKLNETYLKIHSDRGILAEISDFFTFKVPGYMFMPDYKNKIWDGNIRLLNLRTQELYVGLFEYLEKFCEKRDYTLGLHKNFSKSISRTPELTRKQAEDFIKTLGLPFTPRDYQIEYFLKAINNKRSIIVSPTGSGKSLIIYMIIRYLQNTKKKGLLMVPKISLVSQMLHDLKSYGFDVTKYCHGITAGIDKDADKFLYISTWQSIHKLPQKYFQKFDFVIADEAHECKANSLQTIIGNCINASYKIGTTGSLDENTKVHKLVLEGLMGRVIRETTTKELQNNNELSKLIIKCITLKYPEDYRKELKKAEYAQEVKHLVVHEKRNRVITKLTESTSGNTLVLFNYKSHGKALYEALKASVGDSREVFLIHGDVDKEYREEVRLKVESCKNAIIFASYGTYSTGINIKNLHNLILASPTKAFNRLLQSIGRVLRLSDDGSPATLYDISDDLRYNTWTNHTLKHFIERLKIYDKEKHEYSIRKLQL